jgi:hypothetical protein
LFDGLVPEGVEALTRQTRTGYSVEYRIPINYIVARQGADWNDARFNLAIHDIDGAESPKESVTLQWRPHWASGLVGTGMFRKRDE